MNNENIVFGESFVLGRPSSPHKAGAPSRRILDDPVDGGRAEVHPCDHYSTGSSAGTENGHAAEERAAASGVLREDLSGTGVASGRPALQLLERAFALVLLALSSPLLLVVALIVWTSDGRPILYSGARLGRKRRPFTMFKFRTLRVDAQRITGSRLLNHAHDLAIRGGKFLRDTRLDELPQLWNVWRGEMSFVGPRPERPEVYRAECRQITGYERRFDTRPGLIGLCQLHTPHGTHKRYRARIDNAYARRRRGFSSLGIVPYTALVVLRTTVRRTAEHLRGNVVQSRLLGRYLEKRKLRRVRLSAAFAVFHLRGDAFPRHGRVLDMNEQAFLVRCDEELAVGLVLEVRLDLFFSRKDGGQRMCSARCQAFVTQRRDVGQGKVAVLQYRPSTARSDYMIHQYFLRTSLAPRSVAWKAPSRLARESDRAARRA